MMERQAQLWNQYQNLREEIRSADSLNYQTMGIIVGAVAALLTTAIKEGDPLVRALVFLCVFVVTIPGYELLKGNRRRIWRISTYLRTFVEPELEYIQWETRLEKSGGQGSGSSFACTNEWLIVTVVNSLASLGAILSLFVKINPMNLAGVVTVAVFYVCILVYTSRQEKDLRRGKTVEEGFKNSWKALRGEGAPNTGPQADA